MGGGIEIQPYRKMTDEELKECLEFLEYFGVATDGSYIALTSGGNSCIMNPNTQWKKFLGYSINSIARAVADKLNKPVKWIE